MMINCTIINWLSVAICGYLWLSVAICGYLWLSVYTISPLNISVPSARNKFIYFAVISSFKGITESESSISKWRYEPCIKKEYAYVYFYRQYF